MDGKFGIIELQIMVINACDNTHIHRPRWINGPSEADMLNGMADYRKQSMDYQHQCSWMVKLPSSISTSIMEQNLENNQISDLDPVQTKELFMKDWRDKTIRDRYGHRTLVRLDQKYKAFNIIKNRHILQSFIYNPAIVYHKQTVTSN